MTYINLKAHNPAMVMDLYELTMANGYFHDPDVKNTKVAFDVFFRKIPDGGGFAIFAGLEQIIDYITHLATSAVNKSLKICYTFKVLKSIQKGAGLWGEGAVKAASGNLPVVQ